MKKLKKNFNLKLFLGSLVIVATLFVTIFFCLSQNDNNRKISIEEANASNGFTTTENLIGGGNKFLFNSTIYIVSGNVTFSSYLSVSGTTVIYLRQNSTLTVTSTSNLYAGIEVLANSTLIIVGEPGSKVYANGANASNGDNGSNGGDGYFNNSGCGSGAGGRGGNGGRGASAGIGGYGGGGGAGGYGGSKIYYSGSNWINGEVNGYGNNGTAGGNGNDGYGMGIVYILGSVEVTAKGGAGGRGGAGGAAGKKITESIFTGSGGGGGAGGGGGYSARNIGGGGDGGGGGGGGGSGNVFLIGFTKYYMGGKGGQGGQGYYNGTSGSAAECHSDFTSKRASGGAGGKWGKLGDDGTLYIQNSTTCSGRTRDYYTDGKLSQLQYAVTFEDRENGTNTSLVYLGQPMDKIEPPTRVGYTFHGYYTERDGKGTQYYQQDGSCIGTWNLVGDKMLYAYWTANKYNITLDRLDNTGVTNTIVATYDSPMPGISIPARIGYDFEGYYTEKNGEGNKYYNNDGTSARKWDIASNVILYAKWTPKRATVYFRGNNNDSNTSMSSQEFEYGVPTALPANTYTRTGYTFVGWRHSNSNIDDSYDLAIQQSKVNYYNQGLFTLNSESHQELYAIWRNNKYYVRYNANASGRGVDSNCQSSDSITGSMSNSTHYYNISSNLSNNVFTRRGYSFQGWSRDFNATSITYNNQHSISTLSTTDNATVDLYAIWKRNSYTISFNTNGGNGETSPLTMLYNNGNYALPKCGYSRTGYLFEGWTTNSDGTGSFYKDCATVNSYDYVSNVTLYAKWKATWMADVMTKTKFSGGSGTKNDPYQIKTAEDLAYLSRLVQEGNAFSVGASQEYFEQIAPIDLSGKIWLPIGGNSLGSTTASFGGVYDGRGFAIMGLETYSQTDASGNYLYNSVGLFGKTSGAYLKDINLFNAKIYGKSNVGALVGENADKNLTIVGCYARAQVNGLTNVGGLVGNDKILGTQILNSGFAGSVTGGSIMVGSMAGGVIRDCYAEVNSNISFCGSSSGVTLDACVFETCEGKYYYSDKTPKNGITFDGWTTYQGKPLPSGITWVGGVSSTGATLDGYERVD